MPYSASYRPDIDGLRAVAVLAVVLYHAGVPGFSGGFVGVDIFFVISGFLISGIILREEAENAFSFKRFYERRVRRILPALFAMLAGSSVLAYLFLLPDDLLSFGKDIPYVAAFFANVHFWRTIGYWNSNAAISPLVHTWSLGVEEQFYITFPCVFVWLLRHYARWSNRIIAIGIATSFALCVGYSVLGNPETAFFMLPMRSWELLLGTTLALRSWRLGENARVRNVASLVASGGILGSIALFGGGSRFPGFAAALPAISAAVFLDANRGAKSVAASVLSARPVVWLGLISYSLYLWHWPLIAFARYNDALGSGWQVASLVAASVVMGALSWRFVEQPMRRATKGSLRYGAVIVLCGAACLALVVFAIGAELTRGYRGRLSPAVLAYEPDGDTFWREYDRCSNVKSSAVLRNGLCRIGPMADHAPRILVWGDSHANALAPAFRALAVEHGVAGLIATMNGCPPVLEINVPDRINTTSSCMTYNDSVFALVEASGIRTVVLVASWSVYIPEPHADPEMSKGALRLRRSETLQSKDAEGILEISLTRTISKLRSLGVTTYIAADVPLYHQLRHRVALAAARGYDMTKLGVSAAAYRAEREEFDSLFARLVDGDRVRLLDPLEVLCRGPQCAVVAAGRSLYYDDDHLSVEGALALKPMLAPVFSGLP